MVKVQKIRPEETNSDRWMVLHRRQLALETELQAVIREKRTVRAAVYQDLHVWALNDEALVREITLRG